MPEFPGGGTTESEVGQVPTETEVTPTPAAETEPTATPTVTPTEALGEPTAEPTETPAELITTPTAEPTETPAEPIATPTVAPTGALAEPITTPTVAPTGALAEPTAEPTETPAELAETQTLESMKAAQANILLAAPKEKVQYAVKFDCRPGTWNGYEYVKTVKVEEGSYVTPPFEGKDPYKYGYQFLGWYTEKTGGEKFDFGTPINSSFTLYAHWAELTDWWYSVYVLYGDGDYNTHALNTGEEKVLPDQTVSISPEDFYGQSTIRNGTLGEEYVFDEGNPDNRLSALASEVNNNQNTLRIYFKPAPHTLTYQYEGVFPENAPAAPETVDTWYAADVDVAEVPSADGWTFSGWSIKEPAGAEIIDGVLTMPHADVVLSGSWQKTSVPVEPTAAVYSVEHYKQQEDGSYVLTDTEFPLYDKIGKTVTAVPKSYEGYVVNERMSEMSGVVTAPVEADGKPQYLILKVYYDRKIQYDVKFDCKPGTWNGYENVKTVKVEEGGYVTPPFEGKEPYKYGYQFLGWYTDKTGGEKFDFGTPINSSFTLYAHWAKLTDWWYSVYVLYGDGDYNTHVIASGEEQVLPDQTVSISPEDFYGQSTIRNGTLGEEYVFDEENPNNRLSALASEVNNNQNTLRIYFKPAPHTLTYQYEGVVPENAPAAPETVDTWYAADVDVAEVPSVDGWTFSGWSIKEPVGAEIIDGVLTMPHADVVLSGSWQKTSVPVEPTAAVYSVEHYKQQEDGSYVLADTEFPLYDEIGKTVAAASKSYEGYAVNESMSEMSGVVTVPVEIEGKLQYLMLKVYYDKVNNPTLTPEPEEPTPTPKPEEPTPTPEPEEPTPTPEPEEPTPTPEPGESTPTPEPEEPTPTPEPEELTPTPEPEEPTPTPEPEEPTPTPELEEPTPTSKPVEMTPAPESVKPSLSPSPGAGDEDKLENSSSQADRIPKTGDESTPVLWLMLMLISYMGIVFAWVTCKKRAERGDK